MTLLQFAESIANHQSATLHGHHRTMIECARKVVKANGGRLDAVGRYPKGGTVPKPHSTYVDGHWTKFVYCPESDTWETMADFLDRVRSEI